MFGLLTEYFETREKTKVTLITFEALKTEIQSKKCFPIFLNVKNHED